MLLVDAMEGAVGRELSWDEVFGCSAEEQLHSPSKRLCRAAPRASAGCSHGATSPKHPVQRSWGALRDKAKFLLENVIFGSWSLREVGRSRAETGFWKSRRMDSCEYPGQGRASLGRESQEGFPRQ